MTPGTAFLVIVALTLMNSLFVAAEFAVVSLPRAAIATDAARGNRLAQRILAIVTSPVRLDRYIAAAQLGITIASLGLGMFGEHTIAHWLEPRLRLPLEWRWVTAHGTAACLAVAALALLDLVLGEMVPKSLALERAGAFARIVYWPMRVVVIVTFPLVASIGILGRGVLALVGIRRQPNADEHLHTPDELRLIVEESERGGAIRAEAGHLLKELFEFGDLTAGQVMVPRVRVIGLPIGATPDVIRATLAMGDHTRYPIFDGDLDHIIGMIHVKDLLRKLLQPDGLRASDVRPMPVVPRTKPLDDVLTSMQRAHAHMAIVIDEHGGTAGVVSIEDLVEEVVGDIEDARPGAEPIAVQTDGSVRAAGTVRLAELGAAFSIDLEHEEVESVSGLVLARLGRPPEPGDVVDYGRLRLEVLSTAGLGVHEVRATLLPEPEAE